jgi:hypothetical protein
LHELRFSSAPTSDVGEAAVVAVVAALKVALPGGSRVSW